MFKRILFDATHETFRLQAAAFLETDVVPYHDAWSLAQSVPRKIWFAAGKQGPLCRTIPQQYGGQGRDFRDSVVVIEELARRRLPGFLAFLQSDIVAPYVLRFGNKTQRDQILPGFCSGTLIGAIALTAQRKTSAGSVLDFQNTQFRLADLFSDCATNRSFVDGCIVAHLNGPLDPRTACIAKLRTTELLKTIAVCKLQLSGAAGFCDQAGVQATQDLIDSSVQSIWGGSTEIMRDIIGRSLVNIL
ncbi:MAG: acyl-CoA dehydrogenase family protein [Pseudomonadota bacterium]